MFTLLYNLAYMGCLIYQMEILIPLDKALLSVQSIRLIEK